MILESVEIREKAMEQRGVISISVNNRAGGNAPLIARLIAEKFIGKHRMIPERENGLR